LAQTFACKTAKLAFIYFQQGTQPNMSINIPKTPATQDNAALLEVVIEALDDLKVKDLIVMDISQQSSIADLMLVGSGTSNRHLRSMAEHLVEVSKKKGHQPLGIEGEASDEWVLIDLNNVIVHLMLPDTRRFYDLEKLWQMTPEQQDQSS
jgi:ribosome-associated protein